MPAKKRKPKQSIGQREIEKHPDDKALCIGWEYYDSLKQYQSKEQVYTPIEIVQFMVNSSVPLAWEKYQKDDMAKQGKDVTQFRFLDPCCGGGIFPVIGLRKMAELMPLSKKEIVENCLIASDIDLGAVNTTKRALQIEVGEPCRTKVHWADFLCSYFHESSHLEHLTDLAEIAAQNKYMQDKSLEYMRAMVEIKNKETVSKVMDFPWPLWDENNQLVEWIT